MLDATNLALFRLSSIPIDRAVPNEALRCNVAWVRGLESPTLLLSDRQLAAFRRGESVQGERSTRGVPGALLAATEVELAPSASADWCFGLDAGLDARQVVALERRLGGGDRAGPALQEAIASDLAADRARLYSHVAAADGLQVTEDAVEDARQLANALFNAMRGGTFVDNGRVDCADFRDYLGQVAPLLPQRVTWDDWPETCSRGQLVERAEHSGDLDLERLAREYLPLTFSRRHGDPSRPWNQFVIDTQTPDGAARLRYEGNWRDIFQNWEALLHSFPAFAEAAVVKFVNATTRDGHNPYRVTREGFDWEVPDLEDPWAYIGYWGDHQVIYLQRLLDLCESYQPGTLAQLLRRPLFVFADVPYRLAGYSELRTRPNETISFDAGRDAEIRAQVQESGNEARLLPAGPRGSAAPRRVGLGEKLLIPILGKLSHFVKDLGIWMNTQRPEWNDANNALVGHGVSVVTTAYLARHCETVRGLVANSGDAPIPMSVAGAQHLRETTAVLADDITSVTARSLLDRLGELGTRYRAAVYSDNEATHRVVDVSVDEVLRFLDRARQWLLATVAANRREDGLVHAYNLLAFDDAGEVTARRLPLMLEGQVAALASGALSTKEAVELLDALAASPLRREDLGSYLLYPDRELPAFLAKAVVGEDEVERSDLLRRLLDEGCEQIVLCDGAGVVRFAPHLHNAERLARVCEQLALPKEECEELAELYERVFDHAAFTGRSGAFFGYEGLGCVYWHMVSKLRLAVVELWRQAKDSGVPETVLTQIQQHYADIRQGLGVDLEPAQYGAFSSDPYSHTPSQAGVRQPGMTGQVKEDLVARRLELGLRVEQGRLRFGEALHPGRALAAATERSLGAATGCEVAAGAIGFSVCGVPVTLRIGEQADAIVWMDDGRAIAIQAAQFDRDMSLALFGRTGQITRIDVTVRSAGD